MPPHKRQAVDGSRIMLETTLKNYEEELQKLAIWYIYMGMRERFNDLDRLGGERVVELKN